ncbi:MAG: type II secretion system F family protein [Terracidiphilus sp.]
MGFAMVVFIAVFLMLLSAGLLIFRREAMAERVSEAIDPRPRQRTLKDAIQESGFSVGGVVERLQHLAPRSKAETSVVSQRLIRAGHRGESAVKIFYGCKVLVPLGFCALAFATGASKLSPFFVFATALALGFLAPDFWLGKQIKSRMRRIRKGLPDVLDLLIICMEAGLSLDQATIRAAEELRVALPDLCDELGMVVLEQRAGRPRADAWKNLAERCGEESIHNMVAMLIQSEQFGTSIAKTMRVHADAMRTQRIQQVEEKAAKTSIKLLFPLVFCIFPALFLVVLGPAVILMMESFNTLFTH